MSQQYRLQDAVALHVAALQLGFDYLALTDFQSPSWSDYLLSLNFGSCPDSSYGESTSSVISIRVLGNADDALSDLATIGDRALSQVNQARSLYDPTLQPLLEIDLLSSLPSASEYSELRRSLVGISYSSVTRSIMVDYAAGIGTLRAISVPLLAGCLFAIATSVGISERYPVAYTGAAPGPTPPGPSSEWNPTHVDPDFPIHGAFQVRTDEGHSSEEMLHHFQFEGYMMANAGFSNEPDYPATWCNYDDSESGDSFRVECSTSDPTLSRWYFPLPDSWDLYLSYWQSYGCSYEQL